MTRTLADTVVADRLPALVAELAETDDQVKITHGGIFAAMLVSPQKWRWIVETLDILADPAAVADLGLLPRTQPVGVEHRAERVDDLAGTASADRLREERGHSGLAGQPGPHRQLQLRHSEQVVRKGTRGGVIA